MTTVGAANQFNFDNTYARALEGFYVPWKGATAPDPKMVKLNSALALELGLDASLLDGQVGAEIFSGSKAPQGATTLAQAYAGHQFGGFSPQLGDGRALLLGEVIDTNGNRRDIQLKGSGRTPFSRGGDGKAVLGPVLREYIVGEAMHALGIPTTRALAAVTTGEDVMRETVLPGAVLTRVAAGHIRVGTFQFFAAKGDIEMVRQLADYSIARHYPQLVGEKNRYLTFLKLVSDAQAVLIAKWMLVGFVHGVMNTDNMTISGETIDYGPCAFTDNYNPNATFSSIDVQGRYAYKNQPSIAGWNLARLAETLLPLIDEDSARAIDMATQVMELFGDTYRTHWHEGMRAKLGLETTQEGDFDLARDLLAAMEGQGVDYTLFFRCLAETIEGNNDATLSLFDDPGAIKSWLTRWRKRCAGEGTAQPDRPGRVDTMNMNNPLYIPRNHKVEEALTAAVFEHDYSIFETLMAVLHHPFEKTTGCEEFELPAPKDFGPYKTFCGT